MHFIPRSHPSWCGALVGGGDGGEADGGDGDVGVARLEGAGDVGGADVTDRGDATGMVAQAGDDIMWGGDTGSLGSEDVMGRGEDAPSHGDVGFKGGETDIDVGAVGGEGSGGLTDGGVAGADRGERINSLSSSRSWSSSTSFCRCLDFFAGGGWISVEGMVSNAGGGGEVAGIGDVPATATGGDTCAGSSPSAVAAHPCPRR